MGGQGEAGGGMGAHAQAGTATIAGRGGRPNEDCLPCPALVDELPESQERVWSWQTACSQSVPSCRVQLEEEVPFPYPWNFDVALDCRWIPRFDANGGAAGSSPNVVHSWLVGYSTSPPTIELLGRYCSQLAGGVDRLDIVSYGEDYLSPATGVAHPQRVSR